MKNEIHENRNKTKPKERRKWRQDVKTTCKIYNKKKDKCKDWMESGIEG